MAFMTRFTKSLNRRFERPVVPFPDASSPSGVHCQANTGDIVGAWVHAGEAGLESLETLSCQVMPTELVEGKRSVSALVWHMWSMSRSLLMTQASYTVFFFAVVSLGLVHTRVVRWDKVEAAIPILLSSSALR